MPEEKKWWKGEKGIAEEVNDVPLIENLTTTVNNSEVVELQNRIDKLVYDFVSKHEIPNAWCLNYSIDDLKSLKEFGPDCPSCDGSLCIFDDKRSSIITSM